MQERGLDTSTTDTSSQAMHGINFCGSYRSRICIWLADKMAWR